MSYMSSSVIRLGNFGTINLTLYTHNIKVAAVICTQAK